MEAFRDVRQAQVWLTAELLQPDARSPGKPPAKCFVEVFEAAIRIDCIWVSESLAFRKKCKGAP